MKKKLISIIAMCATSLLVILPGCQDFLTERPKSLQSSNSSFNDESSLKLLMLGVYEAYNKLYVDRTQPDVWSGLGMIGEAGSDEVIINPNFTGATQLYAYSGDPEDRYKIFQRWYRYHFNVITRANNVIYYSEKVSSPSEEIRRFIAEAKTLRAWSYFRLAQTFGPVPLIIEPVEPPVDYATPREPLKNIYAQIEQDLVAATDNKVMADTNVGAVEPGRLTHWTAMAMLGKVYLTMASSKDAGVVDQALSSIGKEDFGYSAIDRTTEELYTLAKNTLYKVVYDSGITLNMEPNGYGNLFVAEYRNKYAENMWELQAADGSSNTMALNKGFTFLTNYGISQGLIPPMVNGGGIAAHAFGSGSMIIPGAPYYGYLDGDRRALWNFTGNLRLYPGYKINGKPYTPTPQQPQYPPVYAIQWNLHNGYTMDHQWNAREPELIGKQMQQNSFLNQMLKVTKYRMSANDSIQVPTKYTNQYDVPRNFTVMRFADVVLMYAEACYMSSQNPSDTEALKWMNKIRDRARGWYTEQDRTFGLIPAGSNVGDLIDKSQTPDMPEYTSISIDDIMAERKWELCYENIRWFDLARTGRLANEINNYLLVQPGPYTHRVDLTENDYLFPLPLYEINQSTDKEKFFQNPGY